MMVQQFATHRRDGNLQVLDLVTGDAEWICLRRWRHFTVITGLDLHRGSGCSLLLGGLRRRGSFGGGSGRGGRLAPHGNHFAFRTGPIQRCPVLGGGRLVDIFLDDDAFAGKQLSQLGLVRIEHLTDPGLDLIQVRIGADLAGKCDFE